jgi:hypothetical protein
VQGNILDLNVADVLTSKFRRRQMKKDTPLDER